MAAFPAGTVTFLFTDIEGSTKLLRQLGDRYADVLRDHRELLRAELGDAGGHEIDAQGDAFFFSFPRARDAVAGAVAAQRALAGHGWPEAAPVKVRMGLHTGEPSLAHEGYTGLDVVRAARICSAAHGGQILLSETTRALIGNDLPRGVAVHDLGEAQLKDVQHQRIFQLSIDGQPSEFPPLRTEGADPPALKQTAESLQKQAAAAIEAEVLDQIKRAFAGDKAPARSALRVATTGLVILLLTVATLIAIALLVKVAFF